MRDWVALPLGRWQAAFCGASATAWVTLSTVSSNSPSQRAFSARAAKVGSVSRNRSKAAPVCRCPRKTPVVKAPATPATTRAATAHALLRLRQSRQRLTNPALCALAGRVGESEGQAIQLGQSDGVSQQGMPLKTLVLPPDRCADPRLAACVSTKSHTLLTLSTPMQATPWLRQSRCGIRRSEAAVTGANETPLPT